LAAVSDYWVEHLSLACAICWASRRHKTSHSGATGNIHTPPVAVTCPQSDKFSSEIFELFK